MRRPIRAGNARVDLHATGAKPDCHQSPLRRGWGNSIAIRGDTYPLDWNYGRAARNVDTDVWEWTMERIPDNESFEFKPLINDTTWSTGSNYTGTGGDVIDIWPNF